MFNNKCKYNRVSLTQRNKKKLLTIIYYSPWNIKIYFISYIKLLYFTSDIAYDLDFVLNFV
jgi:uncharacterized membrane protein (GlpM family)